MGSLKLCSSYAQALLFIVLKGNRIFVKWEGLKKSMPITFFCYLAGALALTAIPPFSGFFSKDEILWSLFSSENYGLYLIAFLTGLLTCFYMTRLTVFVFFGQAKTKTHESGWFMTYPLIILALLSLFSGGLGLPHILSDLLPGHPPHILQQLLQSFSPQSFKGSKLVEAGLMLLSTGAGLTVIGWTAFHYLKKTKEKKAFWKKPLEEAFYIPQVMRTHIPSLFAQSCFQLFKRIEQGFFNLAPMFLSSQLLKPTRHSFLFFKMEIYSLMLFILLWV